MVKVIAYHKPCLPCTYDDWYLVEDWARNHGVKLKLRRTAFNPLWHKKAANFWRDEDYPDFLMADGRYAWITIKEAIEMLKKGENDDLFELFRAEDAIGEDGSLVETKEREKEDERE